MNKLFIILFVFTTIQATNAQINYKDTIVKYLNYIVDTSEIELLEIKYLTEADADNLYVSCRLLQIKDLLGSIKHCDNLIKIFKQSAEKNVLLLESNKTSKILLEECKRSIDIWEYYLNLRREGLALVELLNTQELIVSPLSTKTMDIYVAAHFKIDSMPSQIVMFDSDFKITTKYVKYSQYLDICTVRWLMSIKLSVSLRKFNY